MKNELKHKGPLVVNPELLTTNGDSYELEAVRYYRRVLASGNELQHGVVCAGRNYLFRPDKTRSEVPVEEPGERQLARVVRHHVETSLNNLRP